MPRTSYPTDADVLECLEQIPGIPAVGTLHVGFAEAAKEEFERLSGWRLVAPETLFFTAPKWAATGYVIYFGWPLASVDSVERWNAETATGAVLTAHEDYRLEPINAANAYYTSIRLLSAGALDLLRITGTWGNAATIPEQIWQAVLARAAANSLDRITAMQGEITETKTGAVSLKFAAEKAGKDRFNEQFMSAITQFTRFN